MSKKKVLSPALAALVASVDARKADFVLGNLSDEQTAQLFRDMFDARKLAPGKGGVVQRSFVEVISSVGMLREYRQLWQANPLQFMRVQATLIPPLSRIRPVCEGGASCVHAKDGAALAYLHQFGIMLQTAKPVKVDTATAANIEARKALQQAGKLSDKEAATLFTDIFEAMFKQQKQYGGILAHELPSEYEIIGARRDAKHQGQLPCGAPQQSEFFVSIALRCTEDDTAFEQFKWGVKAAINMARDAVQNPANPSVLYVRLMRKALDRDEREKNEKARVHPYATRVYISDVPEDERASDARETSALLATVRRNPGERTIRGAYEVKAPGL